MRTKFAIFVLVVILSGNLHANRVTVIGVGRLGLCLSLVLEKNGYNVLGMDLHQDYIDQLNSKSWKTNEPKVEKYLEKSTHFHATTSLEKALEHSDTIFITIPTTTGSKSYDFSSLNQLLDDINQLRPENKHIVILCTVNPGYIRNEAHPRLSNCPQVTISYNPPFIAQGNIISGFENPDMVLIGEGSPSRGEELFRIYNNINLNSPYYGRMSPASAEIAKVALNSYITLKITFANLIGEVADETPDADKYQILQAIGSDSRIGNKYFRPGYGYGGTCFPRDNCLAANYVESIGLDSSIFRNTDKLNQKHTMYMAKKLLEEERDSYVFQDVSFKENSPVKILQESQKLEVARLVAQAGKPVTIIDTEEVVQQLEQEFGSLFHYEIQR